MHVVDTPEISGYHRATTSIPLTDVRNLRFQRETREISYYINAVNRTKVELKYDCQQPEQGLFDC